MADVHLDSPLVLHAHPASASLREGNLSQATARVIARAQACARDEGRREGAAQARAEAAAALDEAGAALDRARESAVDDLAHTAVDLAVEIARALLRVELPAGRYDLEGMVRETLAFSDVQRGSCVVHLHPADAQALAEVPFRSGTEIRADAGVARGSAHVTTPQGLLVRDVDEALRSISERLHEEVR